ncbi:MAG TPA: Uma2 family endonuclease [Candidatus Eisenbacteria bacterium]|nr:Uma2 family endonuclease [Candidatus Eisenbacteria bacterium]
MATTKVSLEEYLKTSYRPDVEYIDGELQERNVGEIEHARMIMAVLKWFVGRSQQWRIEVLPDVRVQVKAERFRVPDVCICAASNSDTHIVTTAPLVVVEVLSPEDRIGDYRDRIADYLGMGIHGVWMIDPATRKGWDCSTGNWVETAIFRLAASPIYLDLSAI